MKCTQVDVDRMRGDLLALFEPQSTAEGEWKPTVMAGLTSMLSHNRGLAAAAIAAMAEPCGLPRNPFSAANLDTSIPK